MKKILAFIMSFLFLTKLVALDDFSANVAYEKAKSFVKKEEIIGKALKEYVQKNGSIPTLSTLITDGFLQEGFSIINDFGQEITLNKNSTDNSAYIENKINLDTKSIAKFYDYYYSNSNRIYTQAPNTLDSSEVKINLSKIESFVLDTNISLIKEVGNLTNIELVDTYLLQNASVTWYESSTGNKRYTYNGKDIIVYGAITLSKTDATISNLINNGFLSVGSILYIVEADAITQVIYLGQEIFKVIGGEGGSSGSLNTMAKLLITPYSGGYLLNGDIYTWGNNDNKIVTINTKDYLNTDKDDNLVQENNDATIATIVRLKTKSYDTNIDSQNYFSSPSRVKYVDFFSSAENGTCGISEDYKLYCTGINGERSDYLVSELNNNNDTKELLYQVGWFDGTFDPNNDKYGNANKVIAIDKRWYVLANGTKDEFETFPNGNLYTFGEDTDGFAGDGDEDNSESRPKLIVDDSGNAFSFKDIAIAYEKDYKKMYALGTNGEIYLWGMDKENSDDNDCVDSVDNISMNFCKPVSINQLIEFKTVFSSIRSNSRGIMATTSTYETYYVYQDAKDLPKIVKIENYIKDHDDYLSSDDSSIIDIDVIAVDGYSNDNVDVVWINENNQLKGDYNVLGLDNSDKDKLDFTVNYTKWKKVKFIDEKTICAIDTSYQLYCWGRVGFDDAKYETIILPILNTNNFNKFVYDGNDVKGLELKYPTYISGFNYDFIFK